MTTGHAFFVAPETNHDHDIWTMPVFSANACHAWPYSVAVLIITKTRSTVLADLEPEGCDFPLLDG